MAGKIKISNFIANKVSELGVKHVFMVTGGGAMHLNHSFGTHERLKCVFNHHEQACAISAEAYYRYNNQLAIVNVTSGPGGTNAITGVYGAYVDSIGMVVISGQVKWETTVRSTGLSLRQYGDQELDIEELVRPITKYVCMVTDPLKVRYELEKAFYIATHGRPGPVWLDIPLDVQAAMVDQDDLIGFDPNDLSGFDSPNFLDKVKLENILSLIQSSSRPIILAGNGIHLSGQRANLTKLIEKLKIPVVTAWNANDLVPEDYKFYVGRPGTVGDRAGNFAVQNSDLLVVLGSRLNIRQISYNWNSFAREAKIIWIDVDKIELSKPNIKPYMKVHSDLRYFLPSLLDVANESYDYNIEHKHWLEWCKERKKKYPVVLKDYYSNKLINPYVFIKELFKELPEDQIAIAGNGSACVIGFQAAEFKKGQRFWTNSGCATMGYDLPASIGALMASQADSVVCIAGDGSIMMNLQELETISGNHYPIKIFILNNSGYVSIFQTHRNFFNGVEVGGGPKSGVSFPNFEKLSQGFDLPYFSVKAHEELNQVIKKCMKEEGPLICEVFIDENVVFAPKLGAKQHPDGRITSPPLEDLSPFLDRDELKNNMFIEIVDE